MAVDGSCDIGVIGLGVMGRNFALNMAGHGFSVAGYDVSAEKGRQLHSEIEAGSVVRVGSTLEEFVGFLRKPRAVLVLAPAGDPVDAVIRDLKPLLAPGDVIVDGGNSHFTDTDRRAAQLRSSGIIYCGMGISGGEEGARLGPSLMPGGPKEGYERVRPILEAAAARVDGESCVAYMGSGSAGHYVKMVHNGIEYGLMQLIAETYDLMTRGLGLKNDDLHSVYLEWEEAGTASYLIEITARIVARKDEKTGNMLLDLIRDEARQKGTGMWTSQNAMELQSPTPTIDAAVMMRNMSGRGAERRAVSDILYGPAASFEGDRDGFICQLERALYVSMILTYAQGMSLLDRASDAYGYGLNLGEVARIWRGGCIIRAALLEKIRSAYQSRPSLKDLLTDGHFVSEVMKHQGGLREVVVTAAGLGLPAPAFMASLAYLDSCRQARLPTNLIQAQRDFFGAHTYERVDMDGIFHTEWTES